MNLTEAWNWRYATKKFDSSKKLDAQEIEKLKEAITLAPSSYGLQPYKVMVIEDQKTREQLKEASWNQTQITDASHLFVFCNIKKVERNFIEDFFALKANKMGVDTSAMAGYVDFIDNILQDKSNNEMSNWTAKQAYIGVSNLLTAAAINKIDACPMEGFDADGYDKILNLSEKGLEAAVVVAVGYRSSEDSSANAPKVRWAEEELFQSL